MIGSSSNLRATRLAGLFAPAAVDIFAGLGGWSIGAEQAFVDAGYTDKYIDLMINHWDVAVNVHRANHPLTEHLQANILEVDPADVLRGRRIVYLHASPDCTDHSKAKGGKPRRKEIRALADVVIVWAGKRRPKVITLENVEEFQQWGPLLTNGQPDKRRRGEEFRRWVRELEALRYVVEWRELRACDYGAPTTRKRLFVIARCDGKPIVWPEATHGNLQSRARSSGAVKGASPDIAPPGAAPTASDSHRVGSGTRAGGIQSGNVAGRRPVLKPYRTAAECIDFSIPMLSIFATRKEATGWAAEINVGKQKHERIGIPQRPLKLNTQKRLAGGLLKWVLDAAEPFIVRTDMVSSNSGCTYPIDSPLTTVTSAAGHAVADVELASFASTLNHGGDDDRSADLRDPLKTVTAARDARAVVGAKVAAFSVPRYGEREGQDPRSRSLEAPAPTITPTNNGAQLVAVALNKHNLGVIGQSVDRPIGTVTGIDHHSLLTAHLVKFRRDSVGNSLADPMPTVTSGAGAARDAGAAHAMGVSCAYLSHSYTSNNNGGQGDPRKPLKCVTGGGHHAATCVVYLLPYYGNAKDGHTPADPMPTVVSKDRFGLIGVESTPHWVLTTAALRRAKEVAAWARRMLGHKVRKHLLRVVDDATGKSFYLLRAVVGKSIHLVTDVLMRMLRPRELARAQGFDENYIIDRTADGTRISKADQVKLIGNSVPPCFARAIVRANITDLGVFDADSTPAELEKGVA